VKFPASWPVAGIRWYGLSYATGFVIGWLILRWMARTGRTMLSMQAVGDLVFHIVFGVLVGGRLGYAVFYDPALLYHFDHSLPYWDLLAINKGGMASHGGMIGVIIACWLYARNRHIPVGHVFDLAAFTCPPGLFLGRLANFVNGELHGKPVPNQMSPPWWSIKFPQEMTEWGMAKLAQLTSLVDQLGYSAVDWQTALRSIAADPAHAPLAAMRFKDGVVHELIEATQKHDQAVIAALKPMLTAFYPSQFFQAFTDGPILLGLLALIWLRPRKPGVIASWFLIIYGGLRIITEIYREPDIGVPLKFGLSQGQLLSVGLIVVGAIGLWLSVQGKSAPTSGLRRN
jgi:phosphatidylglycerol:prolipoprotein diacylglycerol transferase